MINEQEIGAVAGEVAAEMRQGMSPEVRARFILVRAALFHRGIYDPVLVRFDSVTAPRATVEELAEQLERIAAVLAPAAA
jgi:hypothetical protein